jgi:hypothetical protein
MIGAHERLPNEGSRLITVARARQILQNKSDLAARDAGDQGASILDPRRMPTSGRSMSKGIPISEESLQRRHWKSHETAGVLRQSSSE